jgi:hypothetical protein
MKKIYLLAAVVLLFGCADIKNMLPSGGNSSDTGSAQSRMHTCMLSEAQARFSAGTLFNDSVYNTAKDLASGCMKKLALESMGISEQAQSDATNIINSLRNLQQ